MMQVVFNSILLLLLILSAFLSTIAGVGAGSAPDTPTCHVILSSSKQLIC